MAQKTRYEIIHNAYALFMQKGFFNVSMREIAGTLGISVGNLTYHFKSKEELAEAALLERNRLYPHNLPTPMSIAELHGFFMQRTENAEKDPFYFKNFYQLSEVFPRFKDIQMDAIQGTMRIMNACFDRLVTDGQMKPFDSEIQQAAFVRGVVQFLFYGLQFLEKLDIQSIQNNMMLTLWSMVMPHLTDNGMSVLSGIVSADPMLEGLVASSRGR